MKAGRENVQTKLRKGLMVGLIGNSEDKVVLDLGGGIGKVSDLISYKKRYVLDISKSFKGVDIVCDLNKEEIPLEKESVDVIIAGELIEHLISPVSFLKKCAKVLKRGGIIVLSTPNIASLKNRIKLVFGSIPEYSCRADLKGKEDFQSHIKDFNLNELDNLMVKAGLRIDKVKTNGIIFHSKLIFPRFLTPVSFGEVLIIKAGKM